MALLRMRADLLQSSLNYLGQFPLLRAGGGRYEDKQAWARETFD